jgi:DnaJ-domain-containing protein 1
MVDENDDLYNTKDKCQYTGLPIFMGSCSCFIHRKINERRTYEKMRDEYINFNPINEPPVNKMKKSSSHEILQIEPPVTQDDIKKAYRKLCLVHHPDRPTGCHDEFIKINNAYNELVSVC